MTLAGEGAVPHYFGVEGVVRRGNTRFENRWGLRFKPCDGMRPWDLKSFSRGSLFYLVSRVPSPFGSKSCAIPW